MAMLHPTRDVPRKQTALKSQEYVGYVINPDDSKHKDGKKRQRVQYRIPALHRNVPDDQLPYAMPTQGGGPANAGGGSGTVDIPPKGAKVMVKFDEEDPHLPYYTTASPTTDDVMKDHEGLKEDYPNTTMTVDAYGNKKSVNRKQGTITDTHKSGSTIHRDKDGNCYLYAPGKLVLGGKGGVEIVSDAGVKVHAKGETSIKGSKIGLNNGDAAAKLTPVGERQTPQIPDPSGKTSL